MLTTSHALFTYAAVPAGDSAALPVIGSVLPDLPFIFATPLYLLRGTALRGAVGAAVASGLSGRLARVAHSLLVAASAAVLAILLCPPLLPLVWGWIGHNVVDFFTHHAEAHAHFYPLSEWRFQSPVSYYERDHHARVYMAAEALVAAALVASWLRHERLLSTLEAALHAPALLGLAVAASLAGVSWRRRAARRAPH
jgi:hypothetical protein